MWGRGGRGTARLHSSRKTLARPPPMLAGSVLLVRVGSRKHSARGPRGGERSLNDQVARCRRRARMQRPGHWCSPSFIHSFQSPFRIKCQLWFLGLGMLQGAKKIKICLLGTCIHVEEKKEIDNSR